MAALVKQPHQMSPGHSNVSITLNIYSHASKSMHGDAASRIASIIFGGDVRAES